MPVCSSKTRIVLIGRRGWHQNGWKEAKSEPYVEEIDETCGSWRTNIMSWPRIPGMHSTCMQTKRECFVPLRRYVESHEFSAAANEKLPGCEKPHAKTVAWSCDMEGLAQKNALKDIVNWQKKKAYQLYKVATPCLVDDHNFKKEELETIWELSDVCSQLVFKCLYLARELVTYV